MPSLVIKNLPPRLHRKLKEAAARNRQTMTGQVVAILEEALAERKPLNRLPPPIKGRFPLTNDFVQQAKRAGRL